MEVLGTITSLLPCVDYLKNRASHYREAKDLLYKAYKTLRYILALLKFRRNRRSDRQHLRLIHNNINQEVSAIHHRIVKLYRKALSTRRFFWINKRLDETRTIVTTLENLRLRTELLLHNSETLFHGPGKKSKKSEYHASEPNIVWKGIDEDVDSDSEGEECYAAEPYIISYELNEDSAELFTKDIRKAKRFENAPVDCDWTRFATVHSYGEGVHYYIFVAQHSTAELEMKLYVFEYDGSKFVYDRGIHLKDVPDDSDLSCFDVTEESIDSLFVIYLKKTNESGFYRYVWDEYDSATLSTQQRLIQVDETSLLANQEVDWSRWFMYIRDSTLHIWAFKEKESDTMVKFTAGSKTDCTASPIQVASQYGGTETACMSAWNDGEERVMYQIGFHEFTEPKLVTYEILGREAKMGSKIALKSAPIDCDFSRFATAHSQDGNYYTFIAQASYESCELQLYVFKWNGEVSLYSNIIIEFKNLRSDAGLSCFDVIEDIENSTEVTKYWGYPPFVFYLKKRNEAAFYRYVWITTSTATPCQEQAVAYFGDRNSILIKNIDFTQWFLYYDSVLRICVFKIARDDQMIQFTMDDGGFEVPRNIEITNVSDNTEIRCASALFSGTSRMMYRIVFEPC